VVTGRDPLDATLVFREVVPTESTTVSMVANISGINLAALNAATTFSVTVGNLVVTGTLGDDPKYTVGKTSILIPVKGYGPTGLALGGSSIKLSWTATRLTVTIVRKSADFLDDATRLFEDPGSVFVSGAIGLVNPTIREVTEATLQFGSVSTTAPRPVYLSGSSKVTTTTYGTGAAAEVIDTNTVSVTGAGDFARPTCTLTSPLSGSITGPTATVLGKAADSHGLADVRILSPGGQSVTWSLLTGSADVWGAQTASWTQTVTGLTPGTHSLSFVAVDQSGNESLPLVMKVVNPLALPLRGRWDGLLNAAGANAQRGHFYLTVSQTGGYTGRLTLPHIYYTLTGTLAPGGVLDHTISRGTLLPALRLQGTVPNLLDDAATARITGTLSVLSTVPEVVANFSAHRSPWSTVALAPVGQGFVSLTTARAGSASGTLRTADGYVLTWAGVMGASGQLPLFLPMYVGKGSVSGQFTVSAGLPGTVDTTLDWHRGLNAADKQFPAGFSYQVLATGLRLQPLGTGARVLGAGAATPNARVTLEGDGISGTLTQDLTITTTNVFSMPVNPQAITAVHTAASGLVTGTFKLPGTAVLASYAAQIVGNQAAGYYTAAAPTGSVQKRYGKVIFSALP
jgi:hypothetical protein